MKATLLFASLTFLLQQSLFGFSGAGSGISADPYVITTVVQLQEMENELAAYYVLGNDIDSNSNIAQCRWGPADNYLLAIRQAQECATGIVI